MGDCNGCAGSGAAVVDGTTRVGDAPHAANIKHNKASLEIRFIVVSLISTGSILVNLQKNTLRSV